MSDLLIPSGHFRPPGRDAPLFPTKRQTAKVNKMMARVAEDVSRLTGESMAHLAPVLLEARQELTKELTAWLKDAPEGENRYTAQELRKTLVALDGSMKKMAELSPSMRAALRHGLEAGGDMAIDHHRFELARMSGVFGTKMVPPNIDRALMLKRAEKELIPRHRTSAARYGAKVREDLRQQFAVGVARRENFHQLTNRLQRLGGPKGMVSLRGVAGEPGAIVENISEGLFKRYRHWGARVVRTEGMNSYNVQSQNLIDDLAEGRDEDEPEMLKMWDSSNDLRGCAICADLDRRAVPYDEEFVAGIPHPPAHPNCRCVVSPWDPRWGDVEGEEGPRSVRTRKRGEATKAKPIEPVKADPPKPAGEKKAEPKPKPKEEIRAKPKPKPRRIADPVRAIGDLESRRRSLEAQAHDPLGIKPKEEELTARRRAMGKLTRRTSQKKIREYLNLQKEIQGLKDQAAAIITPPGLADELKAVKAKEKALRAKMTPEQRAHHAAKVAAKAKTATSLTRKNDGFTAMREQIDRDIDLQGYSRRSEDKDLNVYVHKLRDGVAGQHYWDGRVELTPDTVKAAKKFSQEYAKNPTKVRQAMAEAADLSSRAKAKDSELREHMRGERTVLAEMRAEARNFPNLNPEEVALDLQVSRKGAYPMTVRGNPALQPIADKFWARQDITDRLAREAEDLAAKSKDHPGRALLRKAQGVHTVVHESFHGFGPSRIRGSYGGVGVVVEEITTEVASRDHMVKGWGIPAGEYDRGGAYGWFIDPMKAQISTLYDVDLNRAGEILTEASRKMKRHRGETGTPGKMVDQFLEYFPPTGNPSLDEVTSGKTLRTEFLRAKLEDLEMKD